MNDVLVIGAGPAGIASAYALQQAGISYVVYDRATTIASTWNALYPSLRLNTTRFFSHMPGMRFPWRDGIFPTGRQYHNYLLRYVAQHRFNIRLGISVQRVVRDGDQWRVESSVGVEYFRAVVCATGIYGRPIMPTIEGMHTFSGRFLHAHDFKHPNQVTGEHVLVVGNGPSGIDIAIASSRTAHRVDIGIRTGVTMRRRYPLGLPMHLWMMIGARLPLAWCKKLLTRLGRLNFGDTTRDGLPPPPKGSTVITAYHGRELLDAVRARQVHPVAAPVRFEGAMVTLADGTCITPDTVIMATSYAPVLHEYLEVPMQFSTVFFEPGTPCAWEIGPNGQRDFPLLDRSVVPNGRQVVGQPGLYVVGVWYKGRGAMYNFNVEARIMAQQVKEQP